jgi:hypothetical protein
LIFTFLAISATGSQLASELERVGSRLLLSKVFGDDLRRLLGAGLLSICVLGNLIIGEHFNAIVVAWYVLVFHFDFDLILVSKSTTGLKGLINFEILVNLVRTLIL